MPLFLITFFLVYGGMHAYAFWKIKTAFDFSFTAIAPGLFMLFMTLSPIVILILERKDYELAARILAWFGYTWMGLLLLFVSISILIDAYHLIIYAAGFIGKKDLSSFLPSAAATFYLPFILSSLITVYGFFEAGNIRTERITIETSKLPEGVRSLRVAQISDVHIGLINREKKIVQIVDILKKMGPDILVSTGDLIDGQTCKIDSFADLFQDIRPKMGKFAIAGNHEFYAGLDHSLDFIREAGFVTLRGSGATLSGTINIAGVDDNAGKRFDTYRNDVNEVELLSALPQDRFTILLKHRPIVEESASGLFDLQLSGHTHKGQIFPFGLAVRFFYPDISGLVKLDKGSHLYTSRGTGTWGPPVRFLSPPEVTIFDIVRKEKK